VIEIHPRRDKILAYGPYFQVSEASETKESTQEQTSV
jgi:hypothetical protein